MARVTRGRIRGLTENGIAVEGLVELDAIVNELEPPPAGGDGAFAKHGLLTSMPNQVECFAKANVCRAAVCTGVTIPRTRMLNACCSFAESRRIIRTISAVGPVKYILPRNPSLTNFGSSPQ